MPAPTLRTVLFLCTGNYYRSRMAEVFFNAVAGKMGLGYRAVSRGLSLDPVKHRGTPMAPLALQEILARGIARSDALTRLPIAVTLADCEQATRVVALYSKEHRPLLEAHFPTLVEQVEFWEVPDKPGVADLIDAEVKGLIARLLTGGVRTGPPTLTMPEVTSKEAPASKKPITLKVGREVAGRKGKGVTTIFDTPLNEAALYQLATTLKQKCGTGGTVKEGRIEIQGDQRERIVTELAKLGYQVKRVGG